MNRKYPPELVVKIRNLRSKGCTYGEIVSELKIKIPKSSLSWIVRNTPLPASYQKRIDKLNLTNLNYARCVAHEMCAIKREKFFARIKNINLPIAQKIKDKNVAKIALAMLCLGEASKYNPKTRSPFCLGSSDPRIIILFLYLLNKCFEINQNNIRATIQCRADQNTDDLKKYWLKVTGIPERLFYKPLIDPRTVGKPTLKKDYKGVLKITYLRTKEQLELESLAD
ncbi:MAG: hypothetical protein AAB838_01460, partial [Patescibacteria group bacterium]